MGQRSRRSAAIAGLGLAVIASPAYPAEPADRDTPLYTPGNWFLLEDYPREARAKEMEGTVIIQATIGLDGRLHNCTVVQSSGFELLDRTTCELAIRRARYMPAKDQYGDPIKSPYRTRVVWKLPSE